MGASRRQCASCERTLEPGELYYRFAVALEGEQDVVDPTGADARDELKAVLSELEHGPDDASGWEDQVHWERSGVVCPACRERLVALVGGGSSAGPH